MILFVADRHYNQHSGKALYDVIGSDYEMQFYEDDWSCFADDALAAKYELMILNLIGGTCDVPAPSEEHAENVLGYLKTGKPLLLLHGASAAFWPYDWWRQIVGFRWVRPRDPDGFESSYHPKEPYTIRVSKTRHPLRNVLQDIDFPKDEIYLSLEQTCPTVTLMETQVEQGTFPMCYETITPWDGVIVGYLPGHFPEVVQLPENVSNCRVLIDYLLG